MTKAEKRAFLHAIAEWILEQTDASESRAVRSTRIPTVKATEDEREFARGELRAMKTPKRKGRAA